MTVETATDRAAYLADFGETFTVDPTGSAVAVTALYEGAYAEDLGVEGYAPAVLIVTADATAASLAVGSTIRRSSDSTDFTVRNMQPDGQGFTVAVLSEQ